MTRTIQKQKYSNPICFPQEAPSLPLYHDIIFISFAIPASPHTTITDSLESCSCNPKPGLSMCLAKTILPHILSSVYNIIRTGLEFVPTSMLVSNTAGYVNIYMWFQAARLTRHPKNHLANHLATFHPLSAAFQQRPTGIVAQPISQLPEQYVAIAYISQNHGI